MAKEQYGVDLSALEEVVKELNGVLKDMGGPKRKAEHNTYIPKGALGNGFSEESEIYNAHAETKAYIHDEILKDIEDLIDDFGKRTEKTRGAYDDAEHDSSVKPGNMA
jgi:hypothetical protein